MIKINLTVDFDVSQSEIINGFEMMGKEITKTISLTDEEAAKMLQEHADSLDYYKARIFYKHYRKEGE